MRRRPAPQQKRTHTHTHTQYPTMHRNDLYSPCMCVSIHASRERNTRVYDYPQSILTDICGYKYTQKACTQRDRDTLLFTLSIVYEPALICNALIHAHIPTTVSKETYYSVKRDLLQCQKRPTTMSKETYYSVKRDLLQCQKTYLLCMYVIKHRINTFIHSNIPMQITCSTSTHLYLCALQYNVCYKLLHKYTHMLTHKG